MGILDKFFGGGEKQAAKEMGKAYKKASSINDEAYQPYRDAGKSGLDRFKQGIDALSDPKAYYERVLADYKTSPSAQRRLDQGMNLLSTQGAATGFMGSGVLQRALMDYAQQIIGADEQNYFQNIQGINQDYLGGEERLMNQGYNANNSWANNGTQFMLGQGQAKANEARADSDAWTNLMSQIVQSGMDYATGGATAVMRPFTSQFQSQGARPSQGSGSVFSNFFNRG